MHNNVIAIVGPTATGKTGLAIHLAKRFDGEVIGADSRQVYRYMDIGTAKPTKEELARVPHHLIGIINPDQDFSLAEYQQLAMQTIKEIQDRDRLPIVAGGSGLYVKALLEGWGIPRVAPDPDLRQRLEERALNGEGEAIFRELERIDPEAAANIDRRNVRRVIRALEVSLTSSLPFSAQRSKKPPLFNTLTVGLTAERNELYRRIDERVDRMIEQGLAQEVQWLLDKGYKPELPSMSGIGYKEIIACLAGQNSIESAAYQIKTETHRLVRKQYNWFKLEDKSINWFDIVETDFDEIAAFVESHLSG